MNEGRQAPTPEESRKLVNFILKIDSVAFVLAGIAIMLKDYFTDYILIDETMDVFFGAALMTVGIATHIIADKFFGTHK